MKTRNLWMGLFVGLALSACSSENEADTSTLVQGDKAYMAVQINGTDAMSRGTLGDFFVGDEHEVEGNNNAHFYFYDKSGNFVAKSQVWGGGTPGTEGANQNIEFEGNTIVVLTGLKDKSFPNYVVTVLNKPIGFTHGETLTEMLGKLSEGIDGIYHKGTDKAYFVMSTSSYERADDVPYYVTKVDDTNFSVVPITDDDVKTLKVNPVVIYVERLAAKATVGVSDNVVTDPESKNEIKEVDGATLYPIAFSVAGEDNKESLEEYYVKIDGWRLNATAKTSYMMKNFDVVWSATDPFVPQGASDWNDATHFRNYWAKAYNYGKSDYPNSSNVLTPSHEDDSNIVGASAYLNYVNLKEAHLKSLEEPDYCAENTNTGQIVSNNFPSAVTSALVKATICNADGTSVGNMIRCYGLMYTESQFKSYALASLKAGTKGLKYYTLKDNSTTEYRQIAEADVKVVDKGDGIVILTLDGEKEWFTKDENPAATEKADLTVINEELAEFSTTAKPNGYKEGAMYYNIPIEHVAPNLATEKGQYSEGVYGVVRNHWYQITINKLIKLGKGIYDPDEFIVPEPMTDEYYVGAKINILSWKIVNQGADL